MGETPRMSFIPVGKSGKQAYTYDTRSLKIKISMLFWKHVGIPLFGKVCKGKVYVLEHITGNKIRYVNCTFKQCKFDGLKLVFINNSYIEHSTPHPKFSNMNESEIRNCVFKKVEPIICECAIAIDIPLLDCLDKDPVKTISNGQHISIDADKVILH